ncbi:[protein-PII] uridylyltransferase [Methylogaea oryzae]|uniref:[protein-PII] uridylyltransferase n=1 Tax=Methylogaea oryzae TaxID=1295382 RepID=UPI000AFD28FE|nr:[protein-PII] uridylyltransferase [Methylogaea oryzae]
MIRGFDTGVPVADLLHAKAAVVDRLLIACWKHFLGDRADGLCLVAVGGYGRRELHPHSDVDLLLLTAQPLADNKSCADPVAALFRFLWDIGLKPGQSVRTVEECEQEAERDQTVITNLIECRHLCGDIALFQQLEARLAPERLWPAQAFFTAKLQEQEARYHKYHDTAYNLEPNVKDGPGGLRDIQIIGWVTRRLYGAADLIQLVSRGILSHNEYLELNRARDFLWTIRFALHSLAGRCEDRLLFEYQKQLADRFGYLATDGNQAVEEFMQQYFRTIKGVERLNEMLLQLFQEAMPSRQASTPPVRVDEYFHSVGGYLEAVNEELFRQRPLALLEIFLALQKNPSLLGIRASTIRLIRGSLDIIDDDFRRDPAACRLFMQILREPQGIVHQLRRMNRHGVLAAYLPEFAKVVGRMQFDLFHVYTVDEHSLFVVRNLRRFTLEKHREELPFAYDLSRQIAKPELLYIAGLLHDIAKGSGGDHSEMGERIAGEFCRRHGLGDDDTKLVTWLVRNHLLMSLTAQRKDIADPDVVHEFASAVGSEAYLNHIYLLTLADIRATNPNLWNSWKDALFKELYAVARRALRRGLHNPIAQGEICAARRHDAQRITERLGLPAATTEIVWANLGDEYFLRFAPEEIAWHTIALAGCRDADLPLVLLRPESRWGSAEAFVYMADRDYIFACSTAVLDQLNLTILDARLITTSHGYVLISYQVLEQNNAPIENPLRQTEIADRLRASLLHPTDQAMRVARRQPSQVKHFAVRTQVYFHDDAQARHTVMELLATDQPGLLSKVGQAFTRHGIRVLNAKVSTIGSRAEDVFHITDRDGKPLATEAARQALHASLLALIDEG